MHVYVEWQRPHVQKQYNKLNPKIKKRVDELIRFLQHNDNRGIEIKKKQFPKKYRGLTNMFKYDLNGDRVLYTISTTPYGNDRRYTLLEVLCHNEYSKLFGYRTN